MTWTLFPHFFAFFLTGGLLAFPGSCFDLILRDFEWSPSIFGFAMMAQGVASFVGSRFASRHCGGEHYRRWTVRSLFFLAAGVGLYYFSDWTTLPVARAAGLPENLSIFARFLGICLFGFGIGTNGIFNNAAALCSAAPAFALNLLNMGFTAGAVLVPFTTSQFLRIEGMTSGTLAWRLPVALLVCLYIVLSFFVLRTKSLSQPPPVPSHSEMQHERRLPLPVLGACLVLFCYVGSEINLSNSLGLMSENLFGHSNSSSRVASSFFWGGLLSARLFFTFRSPSSNTYPKIMTILSAFCLFFFVVLLSESSDKNGSQLFLSRAVILCLGLCIGGMYSLTLGALTLFFDSVQRSRHYSNVTVLSGVAGAVLLPFTFNQILGAFGLRQATVFIVLLLSGMLTGAILLMTAQTRSNKPAPDA